MIAIATGYKKAGLFGLFLWLAAAAVSAGLSPALAEPSLLEQLQKGGPSAPAPRKSTLPPLRLQIASAAPILDERTKEPVVTFRLTDRSGRMFAQFTADNIGRTVEVRIDGKVVMRPIIHEAIKGGSVQVSGGFTLATARELADRLNSGAARVEAEVVD
jgi:hypothetical protein